MGVGVGEGVGGGEGEDDGVCGWVAVGMSWVGGWVKSSTCRTHLNIHSIPHLSFRHPCLSTFLPFDIFSFRLYSGDSSQYLNHNDYLFFLYNLCFFY